MFLNAKVTIDEFIHYNQLIELIEKLKTPEQINYFEPLLRQLEVKLSSDNIHLIIKTVNTIEKNLILEPVLVSPQSVEDACFQRYIYVPILYRLGFTKEAAELGQLTFEYLFPQLHHIIIAKLKKLFNGDDLNKLHQDIFNLFSIKNDNILRIYSRMKSTNSIWKKVENIQKLQSMTPHQFANTIDDFIALRWNMRVNEGENRYDALLNGVVLVPNQSIIRFRNQQIAQLSGFSSEPVMKFYYVIQNVPVELQLLGGYIEQYMCVKGYSNYKMGFELKPLQLSEEEQNARLGLSIYYAEHGFISDFHKMMLDELLAEKKINYNDQHIFIINRSPNNSDNQALCFSGNDVPVYLTSNYVFESNTMNLFTFPLKYDKTAE